MPYTVDSNTVSTVGLESSPVAAALAGLRAHEARYFKNKYDHVFKVEPASNAKTTIEWVRITPKGVNWLHDQETPVQVLRELRQA